MQSFKYFGLSISQHLNWTTSLKGRGRVTSTQVPRNDGPTEVLHEGNPTITRHSTHPRHILFNPYIQCTVWQYNQSFYHGGMK